MSDGASFLVGVGFMLLIPSLIAGFLYLVLMVYEMAGFATAISFMIASGIMLIMLGAFIEVFWADE